MANYSFRGGLLFVLSNVSHMAFMAITNTHTSFGVEMLNIVPLVEHNIIAAGKVYKSVKYCEMMMP